VCVPDIVLYLLLLFIVCYFQMTDIQYCWYEVWLCVTIDSADDYCCCHCVVLWWCWCCGIRLCVVDEVFSCMIWYLIYWWLFIHCYTMVPYDDDDDWYCCVLLFSDVIDIWPLFIVCVVNSLLLLLCYCWCIHFLWLKSDGIVWWWHDCVCCYCYCYYSCYFVSVVVWWCCILVLLWWYLCIVTFDWYSDWWLLFYSVVDDLIRYCCLLIHCVCIVMYSVLILMCIILFNEKWSVVAVRDEKWHCLNVHWPSVWNGWPLLWLILTNVLIVVMKWLLLCQSVCVSVSILILLILFSNGNIQYYSLRKQDWRWLFVVSSIWYLTLLLTGNISVHFTFIDLAIHWWWKHSSGMVFTCYIVIQYLILMEILLFVVVIWWYIPFICYSHSNMEHFITLLNSVLYDMQCNLQYCVLCGVLAITMTVFYYCVRPDVTRIQWLFIVTARIVC